MLMPQFRRLSAWCGSLRLRFVAKVARSASCLCHCTAPLSMFVDCSCAHALRAWACDTVIYTKIINLLCISVNIQNEKFLTFCSFLSPNNPFSQQFAWLRGILYDFFSATLCNFTHCLAYFLIVCKDLYTLYNKYTYFIDLSHTRSRSCAPAQRFFNLLTTNFNICCQFARFRHYSSDKSFMSGLNLAIKSNFFALLQPLSCFSLAMASSMLPQSST